MEISPIDAFQISVGGLANPHFWIGSNGNVSVGTTASKLQIGSVGASGYGGDDIAFGNGTQASGIAQTATVAQWYSTTNIAPTPFGNGHGRVGINTTTPGFPLEVLDFVLGPNDGMTWFNDVDGVHPPLHYGTVQPQVSIRADSQVLATEFDAYSDARIKNITGHQPTRPTTSKRSMHSKSPTTP